MGMMVLGRFRAYGVTPANPGEPTYFNVVRDCTASGQSPTYLDDCYWIAADQWLGTNVPTEAVVV